MSETEARENWLMKAPRRASADIATWPKWKQDWAREHMLPPVRYGLADLLLDDLYAKIRPSLRMQS